MRIVTRLVVLTALCTTPAMAESTPSDNQQALTSCVVMKSTGADRQALVRWILGSLASSSMATNLVKVDAVAKDQADRALAAMFTRLIDVDCAHEIAAMANAGDNSGVEKAFGALGEIAMTDAMADRSVSDAMGAFARFMPKDGAKKP